MKQVPRLAVIGALLSLLIGRPAAAAESAMTSAPTTGGWVNEFCAFDHFDPQTGEANCWGATQFAGTWTGHTIAHVQAHVDLATGDIRIDRIDETFIGVASDGSSGTLHFLEHGYVDGASHTFYVEATIIKGTGDWIGASGQYVFDGYLTGDATGIGGWHGEWTRPSRPVKATGVSPLAAPTSTGPALRVKPDEAAAALSCPEQFSGAHEPLLFIHGTSYTAKQAWSWNYGKVLPRQGYDVCTVQLPDLGRADIQVSAEYIVSAIRAVAARSHSKVDLVSFSQGPLEARWALKWWPDLLDLVDDSVMIAAPNHGFAEADAFCTPSCVAPFWQMRVRSAFIRSLNQDDETPGDVAYTSVYSRTDQFLQPNVPTDGTAALVGGTTIAVQDVCPTRSVEHIAMVSDAVVYAVVMDAITHPGPATLDRIAPTVCSQSLMPGVDQADAESDRINFYRNAPVLLGEHHTPSEPPLAPYGR